MGSLLVVLVVWQYPSQGRLSSTDILQRPIQARRSRAERGGQGTGKENEQVWVSHWKAGPHTVTAFHVDRVERCQFATRGSTRNWPRGLSSEEFFGLHCQMPVQLCNCVVGHLADLFFYEPNGVL